MVQGRVPTGIAGLDPLIEGGLPRGSLVLVAGNPGTGKTCFSAEFLYQGATKFSENGLFVSFAEGRETFIENTLKFGLDFRKPAKEGKFEVLDLVTFKEKGMETIMEMVMSEVASLRAQRLVIDSFSAVTNAFEKKIDARIFIHILSKMVRQTGCTTLLIIEVPTGSDRIGLGIEEFLSDGIFILKRTRIEGRLARELEIAKLRGTKLKETVFLFSLNDGFHVFPPFEQKPIEKPKRFKPISDSATHFSTGSPDLDKLLGGGYPRGGVVLIEVGENVSTPKYHLLLVPTPINFMSQKRGVMIVPSIGLDSDYALKTGHSFGFKDGEMHPFLRVAEGRTQTRDRNRPCVVTMEARTIKEDFSRWMEAQKKLVDETHQPVLEIIGLDAMKAVFGGEDLDSVMAQATTHTRHNGNVTIALGKPGTGPLTQGAANICDVHLKLVREHGALLLFGLKPRTGLYVMEMDVSEGYPLPKVTPIV